MYNCSFFKLFECSLISANWDYFTSIHNWFFSLLMALSTILEFLLKRCSWKSLYCQVQCLCRIASISLLSIPSPFLELLWKVICWNMKYIYYMEKFNFFLKVLISLFYAHIGGPSQSRGLCNTTNIFQGTRGQAALQMIYWILNILNEILTFCIVSREV